MDYNTCAGIDLHVHSTASDGSLSPVEILTLADQLRLGALAITDHDTVDGCAAAMASGIPCRMRFLTGVEISASWPPSFAGAGSFHLLGYGFRIDDPLLNQTLGTLQDARRQRNPRIIEKLNALGMDIDLDDISSQAAENVQLGRPHIASAMVQKGFVASINAAFDRFLGNGKPAYVDKFRVTCSRAIDMIIGAGGLPVLAHPGLLKIRDRERFETLVLELKSMGLRGIEAYYPEHGRIWTTRYLDVAQRYDLLVTGGTDFHGAIKPEIQIGFGTGEFHVPYAVFERLTAGR